MGCDKFLQAFDYIFGMQTILCRRITAEDTLREIKMHFSHKNRKNTILDVKKMEWKSRTKEDLGQLKGKLFYYLIRSIVSFFLHSRGISVIFFRHANRSPFTATFSDGFFILDMTVTFATVEPGSFARIRIIR